MTSTGWTQVPSFLLVPSLSQGSPYLSCMHDIRTKQSKTVEGVKDDFEGQESDGQINGP